MTTKVFSLITVLLLSLSLSAQDTAIKNTNLSIVTGIDIPPIELDIAEIAEYRYRIREQFGSFNLNQNAYSIAVYSFSKNGELVSFSVFNGEQALQKNQFSERWVFTYKDGRLSRSFNSGPPELSKKLNLYRYNATGHIVEVETFSNDENSSNYGKATHKQLFAYDPQQRITEARYFDSFRPSPLRIQRYAYSVQSDSIHSMTSDYQSKKGSVITTAISKVVDPSGLLIEYEKKQVLGVNLSVQDSVTNYAHFNYEYLPKNNVRWASRTTNITSTVNDAFSVKRPTELIKRTYIVHADKEKMLVAAAEQQAKLKAQQQEQLQQAQQQQVAREKQVVIDRNHEIINRLYITKDYSKPPNTAAHYKYKKKRLYDAYKRVHDEKPESRDTILMVQDKMIKLFDTFTKDKEKALRKAKTVEQLAKIILENTP